MNDLPKINDLDSINRGKFHRLTTGLGCIIHSDEWRVYFQVANNAAWYTPMSGGYIFKWRTMRPTLIELSIIQHFSLIPQLAYVPEMQPV